VLIVSEARPPASVVVARTLDPSRNWTVPVGVPFVAVTEAENVTGCPASAGLADEASEVTVAALLTVWDRTGDVEPAQALLPP
jgi:hypothetical protein